MDSYVVFSCLLLPTAVLFNMSFVDYDLNHLIFCNVLLISTGFCMPLFYF